MGWACEAERFSHLRPAAAYHPAISYARRGAVWLGYGVGVCWTRASQKSPEQNVNAGALGIDEHFRLNGNAMVGWKDGANGRERRGNGNDSDMAFMTWCYVPYGYLLARLYRPIRPNRAPSVWRNEIHSFITLYNWEIKFFYFLWRAFFFSRVMLL